MLFITRTLFENWRRMLLLAASITLFATAYNSETDTEFSPVESIFQDGGQYYYKLYSGGMQKFDTEQKLFKDKMNGSIVYLKRQTFSVLAIASIVVGSIMLIAFCVIAAMEDWDVNSITTSIVYDNYETEAIDNVYHHHAFGRLIEKSTNGTMNARWLTPIKVMQMPRFKTRVKKREDKLNQIGI